MGLKRLLTALAYQTAGADILFVESLTESEFAEIAHRLDAPLLANMVEGGRSPVLSQERLQELGYAIAIYPRTGFLRRQRHSKLFMHMLGKRARVWCKEQPVSNRRCTSDGI